MWYAISSIVYWIYWLVVSNMNFIFRFIYGIILPLTSIDVHFFLKMVKTTNQYTKSTTHSRLAQLKSFEVQMPRETWRCDPHCSRAFCAATPPWKRRLPRIPGGWESWSFGIWHHLGYPGIFKLLVLIVQQKRRSDYGIFICYFLGLYSCSTISYTQNHTFFLGSILV